MNKLRLFFAGLCALALLSCSSNSAPPADRGDDNDEGRLFDALRERSRSALELPPDLLSTANARVRENAAAGAAHTERVLPPTIGVEIRSKDGRQFLEIAADAEVVWEKLNEFWSLQEIALADYQPEAGIMETDWFSRTGNAATAGGALAVASGLLEDFIARRTAADKFTLRLERAGDDTRVFVTHRRREKIAKEFNNLQKSSEYNWVERDADPEKIAQLLQALVVLFSGEDEAAGDAEPS